MIPPILLVGCGRMGRALLTGWREQGLAASAVIDPAPEAASLGAADLAIVPDAASLPSSFRPAVVVLAVKPQMAAEVLPALARFASSAVFLSIMAGRTVSGLRALLGPEASVVRAMPNTPAAVGRGVSVAFAGPGVPEDQRVLCETLLSAVGTVAVVDDENMLDAVTAVSGSGPAYVFLLVELLEQAGVAQGLPQALARMLARETVVGAGALLEATGEEASALRQGVTSPRGTTERALSVLMQPGAWPASVSKAVAAAAARSRELAA